MQINDKVYNILKMSLKLHFPHWVHCILPLLEFGDFLMEKRSLELLRRLILSWEFFWELVRRRTAERIRPLTTKRRNRKVW